jgi:heptose-I-phosphate ethanolaminephosphotransferase
MLSNQNWINLLKYFLLFFYFSAIYQTFCFIFNVSGSVGLRDSFYSTFLCLIPILLFPKNAKQISSIISFLLWFASLPSLLYFMLYGQEFSQSVIYIIFESNIAEGNEFINTYFVWWLIPVVAIYTVIPYLLWKSLKQITLTIPQRIIITIVSLLMATTKFTTIYLVKNQSYEKAINQQMIKMQAASPWNIVVGYIKYKEVLKSMEKLLIQNSKLAPLTNLIDTNTKDINTFILVIGESTNRNRMSLYGYNRKTTPHLDKIKDELIVFKNVFSPRPYTIEVLQQDLTFADEQNPDLYLSKVNLINIMKQAGYTTYWITNQQTQTQYWGTNFDE